MKLLITDLDNTLYDWVTFFAQSFRAMVAALVRTTGIPEDILLDEFKAIHQKYSNSEYPFAVLELPSVRAKYVGRTNQEILAAIDPALHEFNRTRAQTLQLYDGVAETLAALKERNVVIVAHTEAVVVNAGYRLRRLGIDRFFTKLYALDGFVSPHPRREAVPYQPFPVGFVESIPSTERKPNPRLLLDICARLGFGPKDAIYVGDSLTRDMSMARQAGVLAVWAKYGTQYDRTLWSILVRVTHWSDDDVRREEELRHQYADVKPDKTISRFQDLLPLFDSGAVHVRSASAT